MQYVKPIAPVECRHCLFPGRSQFCERCGYDRMTPELAPRRVVRSVWLETAQGVILVFAILLLWKLALRVFGGR